MHDGLLGDASVARRLTHEISGIDDLRFIEVAYPAGSTVARHEHEHAYLCLVLSGGLRETYCQRPREAARAHALWYRAGASHSGRLADASTAIFHVEIAEHHLGRWMNDPGALDRTNRPKRAKAGWTIQLWRAVLDDEDDLVTACLAVEALAEVAGRAPYDERSPPWLLRIRDRIRDDLQHPPTLDELAVLAERHRTHVARAFRAKTGLTLGHYRQRAQLAASLNALRLADPPLAEVAYALGFADQSHMGRVFRKLTRWSPGAFRSWVRSETASRGRT